MTDSLPGLLSSSSSASSPPPPRHKGARMGRLLIAVVVLAGLVVLAAVGLNAVLSRLHIGSSKAADYAGTGTGSLTVQVPEGAVATQIGRTLAAQGVVKSAAAFQSAAQSDSRSRTIQPGYYRLRREMKASAALTLLLDPSSRVQSTFTIAEGAGLRSALPIIAKATRIPLAKLQDAAKRPQDLGLPAYATAPNSPEGFVFPATYTARPDASATDVLKMMVGKYRSVATGLDLENGARAEGLTPLQVVTLASIVEREVAHKDDRGKVSRVVVNRLQDTADFPTLGMDSTVRYALDDYQGPLTQSKLAIDSPFNTRKYPGFPPGPIGNPGEAALRAALHPTPGPWTYFVSLPKENQTIFTASNSEFASLQERYRVETGGG
jgi:UPF0755 protein